MILQQIQLNLVTQIYIYIIVITILCITIRNNITLNKTKRKLTVLVEEIKTLDMIVLHC